MPDAGASKPTPPKKKDEDILGLGAQAPADIPSKSDVALQTAITNNQKATAAFPGAPAAVAQSNALAKSLTPDSGSISDAAANVMGLKPSDTAVIARPVGPSLPPVAKPAPSVGQMVAKLSTPKPSTGPMPYESGTSPVEGKAIPPQQAQELGKKAAASPSFADMLRKLGFNVANLIQSAAYGATGNMAPTIGDVAGQQQFEMEKAKATAETTAQQNAIEQQYMLDRIAAQARFQASTNKEQAAVDLQNDLVKIEAEKKARLQEIAASNKNAAGQTAPARIGQSVNALLGGG